VIAVDDGVVAWEPVSAVLATMRAMVPTHLVFATPIADRRALDELRKEAVAVALQIEEGLTSVASRYQSYREITDAEALELVECARARSAADSTRKLRAVPSSMPPPA
jgi:predicted phosphoribosyltransferase